MKENPPHVGRRSGARILAAGILMGVLVTRHALAQDAGMPAPSTGVTAPVASEKASLRARWLARDLSVGEATAVREAVDAHARANPADAANWVWLAQANYWEGLQLHDANASDDVQRAAYERAVAASKKAQQVNPRHPGGWFWDGVNSAKVGELRGVARSVTMLPHLMETVEKTDALEVGYFYSGTDRFRAAVITRTPSLIIRMQGGSLEDAERFYQSALKRHPTFAASKRFLAEYRFRQDRDKEAAALLREVINAPDAPDEEQRAWNRHEKKVAAQLLKEHGL